MMAIILIGNAAVDPYVAATLLTIANVVKNGAAYSNAVSNAFDAHFVPPSCKYSVVDA